MIFTKKRLIVIMLALVMALGVGLWTAVSLAAPPPPPPPGPSLPGTMIPKFVNQLLIPPVYQPTVVTDPITGAVVRHDYTVDVSQFQQQVLPAPLPQTTVWGYGGMVSTPAGPVYVRNSPAATFEETRGIPARVTWQNNLTGPHLLPVDPTLHWADPNNMGMPMTPFPAYPPGFPMAQSIVPIVTHLHGAEDRSDSDGNPDAWWTNSGVTGPAYSGNVFDYPNAQPATTLWYHDHTLGITRLNTMAGLAGFYLLRDPADTIAPLLPSGQYEVPLAIQDRSYNADGSLWFDSAGINPTIHPYWVPEFFGDTIIVNGRAWPNLNVEPRQYRFRVLNGSNARFYSLSLSNRQSFTQIGSDGGYLPAPAVINSLLIAPGERADILVDFSALAPGTRLIMTNDAKAPYPNGAPVDPKTVGKIMQFTVTAAAAVAPATLPATLNTMPVLTPNKPVRTLTLNEVMGPGGPTEVLLNGQKWSAPITETPQVGSTEDWQIVNMTADAHPMHLHLVQFQVVSRQAFNLKQYDKDWTALNGMPPLMAPTIPLAATPYLKGKAALPAPNEQGWKDTVRMNPGEVTTIRVRYAPLDAVGAAPGLNQYPFDPTVGPGYVWHCHILDHEDNEMMRPLAVTP